MYHLDTSEDPFYGRTILYISSVNFLAYLDRNRDFCLNIQRLFWVYTAKYTEILEFVEEDRMFFVPLDIFYFVF
jgi:hypothetical protein